MAHAQLVDEADMNEFATVAEAYQDCLDEVERRLASLGFNATTRVKTTTTLLEKLQRESARLSQVHDLAGARLVVGDRVSQDESVALIQSHFDGDGPVKVIDRRDKPSYGYRAVHLVVHVDGIPVEIQVRTSLQDAWAQLMERLADDWGREIRYGGDPLQLDALLVRGTITRRQAVDYLIYLSEAIAHHEQTQVDVRGVKAKIIGLKAVAAVLEGATELRRDAPDGTPVLVSPEAVAALLELDAITQQEPVKLLAETRTPAQVGAALSKALMETEARLADFNKQTAESGLALRGMLEAIALAASDQE
jgi:ppGpp synthetase/RelA/SpoT-type nucleotidyltranferase